MIRIKNEETAATFNARMKRHWITGPHTFVIETKPVERLMIKSQDKVLVITAKDDNLFVELI